MAATSNPSRSLRFAALTHLSRVRRHRFFPLLAAAVATGVAFGGPWTARPAAQDQTPVFRARTELVCLDVSVTDKDGRPVADLRPDELDVTEGRQHRQVLLFRHLSDPQREDDGAPLGLDEVSRNELAVSGHLYVLVFDQLHIGTGHEQRARLAAERFLSTQVRPGDAIAIYGLPGPGPMLSFTTDLIRARALLREVRGQAGRTIGGLPEFDAYRVARGSRVSDVIEVSRPADPFAEVAAPGSIGGGDVKRAAGEAVREQASHIVAQADARGQIFLSQLATVMKKLRMIEGRKAFVLFSEGFFIDNLTLPLEQVASAAAQSHSVVYAIDLNMSRTTGESAVMMSAAELSERRDPLATLATETNGRLVTGATNLDRTLSQIAAETNDYYLVGFEPSPSAARSDYHRVRVNVKRPGLVVRARTGYSSGGAATSRLADRQAIDVALGVPRVSSALPIEYTTYEKIGENADKPRIIVSATAQVPCSRQADRQAEVVFVVRDTVSGQAVASGTDQVRLPASTDEGPGRLDDVHYAVQFDVPPGEYWMRMLVREPGGVIGTADRRFHVWSLDGPTLTTSDLIVARVDRGRFDPPTNATVRHDDDVLAYLEVYGAPTTLRSAGARVEVVRAGSDEVVATAEAIVKSGSAGERVIRARLPVAGLSEGRYAARVKIACANQSPRTVTRSFRVVADAHEQ